MSGAQWGDVPTWIAAGAALAALVFGLVSVLQVQRGRREERDFARDGVAAMWQASEVSGPDVDGKSTSRYVFTVVNPGRSPIRDVFVEVDFQIPVSRVRDGQAADPADRRWELVTPVIGGGAERVWERRLEMAWADRERLHEMTAVVHFHDSSGISHNNRS